VRSAEAPPRPGYDLRLVALNDREIEIRLGDVVIGGVDYAKWRRRRC
jgi:hypothetical protein